MSLKETQAYIDALTNQLSASVMGSSIYKKLNSFVPDWIIEDKLDVRINNYLCKTLRPHWKKTGYNLTNMQVEKILAADVVEHIDELHKLRKEYPNDNEFYKELAKDYRITEIPDDAKPIIQKVLAIKTNAVASGHTQEHIASAVADSNNKLVVDQLMKNLGIEKPAILATAQNQNIPNLAATSSRSQLLP